MARTLPAISCCIATNLGVDRLAMVVLHPRTLLLLLLAGCGAPKGYQVPETTPFDSGAQEQAQDAGPDAGSKVDSGTPADAGPSCLPNNDGTVTRSEMPLGAGLHGTFRV